MQNLQIFSFSELGYEICKSTPKKKAICMNDKSLITTQAAGTQQYCEIHLIHNKVGLCLFATNVN